MLIPVSASGVATSCAAAPATARSRARRATADDQPLDAAAMAGRLAPLASADGLLLAVSGGPDSMALLRLVAEWAAVGGRPPVSVATVDHGLRTEAADECARVVAWAGAAGLAATVLRWQGGKPTSAVQERARSARYRLLADHARAIGASHLVLAHHADDAAETVLLRLLRGSGIAGLAGMEPQARLHGLVLARPLLDVPKSRLVATCRAFGQLYVTDPSNDDTRFARPRLRQAAALLAAEGLGRTGLLRLARRAARADAALARMAASSREACVRERGDGIVTFTADALCEQPAEIVVRVLGDLVSGVRGADGGAPPLRLERLERLAARLIAARARRSPLKSTLAGTILSVDRSGQGTIVREGERKRGREA